MSIIAAELTLIDENTALRARVAKLEEALTSLIDLRVRIDDMRQANKGMAVERDASRARVAKLEEALVEVGDFLADDCVENYPFDRIPGSFAAEADRLLKIIKDALQ